jgi:hypothetical protein
VRLLRWSLFTVTLVVLAGPTLADDDCSESSCEPRIKFLDDLFHPFCSSCERDPYEERIETDRHDFTQSTKTVGCGVWQIEAGYSYFYKDADDEIEQSHTTPEMLLRWGVSDDIEFRLRWNYAWRFIDEADNLQGAEDLRWSFKLGVTESECWLPESALEIRFTAPTGGSDWSTEHIEFGLDYIYGWELCNGWELSASTGFDTDALGDIGFLPEEPTDDHFMAWHQSVALGMELSEYVTLYSEIYGVFSHAAEDDFSIVIYNMGIDYFVTDNFVLDVRAGVGLTEDSDDLFTGFGGGYRF